MVRAGWLRNPALSFGVVIVSLVLHD